MKCLDEFDLETGRSKYERITAVLGRLRLISDLFSFFLSADCAAG